MAKKKEEAKPPTLADFVLEAITAARRAYEFNPSSYTHGALAALMRIASMLPKESQE